MNKEGGKRLSDILSTGRAFWDAQVLLTAAALDIFDRIEEFTTADDVAKAGKFDARAARMILDALASKGFAEKKGDAYRTAPAYAPFLLASSPDNVLSILRHYRHMYGDWGALDEALRTGKPVKRPAGGVDKKTQTRHFIAGMDNLTRFITRRMTDAIEYDGAVRILDVGSGPATYLRAMLKENPKLHAVILDLPEAAAVAREFLEKEGLLKRVAFIEGDLVRADYGAGYDVVLISQVLHSLDDEMKQTAVDKAFAALKPGGRLYVHEFYMNERRTGPRENVVFCLNMLLHASGGDNLTPLQIRALLKNAGFKAGRTIRFSRPATVLVEGVKR